MRAVLCGYYGQGNGGDEALLATLLQMLPAHVTPLVLSGNPQETRDRYQVESCDRMSTSQVWQALRQSDAFIWGGGSLMQDATSALSPFYYGGLMGLAQQFGLKTIAWGQGIGPLHRALTRHIARRVFSGCTAVSVRDHGSAALLTDWQVPFTLAPDPVWALQSHPVDLGDRPHPRVAVALRTHPQLTAQRLETLGEALVLFQQATQAHILLIPFQPVQDLAIAQTLHAQLPTTSQIITLADPQQLMGLFRDVDVAIAMRLHGLIMASAAQCRCFALSYDPKINQLMQDLNLPGWTLDQIPTNPTTICQTWLDLYQHSTALSTAQIQTQMTQALQHKAVLEHILR